MLSWTAPFTAVANTAFTAAQFNLYVRDNLLETAPAKATTAGRIFVSTGVNAIAEREITDDFIATGQTTTSTTYTDLATLGPTVTVATGVKAVAFWSAGITNSIADEATLMSVAVSGATTTAAADSFSYHLRGPVAPSTQRAGAFHVFTLTLGNNTFRAKYRANAGTATFVDRRLIVIAL